MKNVQIPIIIISVAVIILILFGSSMVTTIQPGEAGVLFKPWSGGIDKSQVFTKQGYTFKAPWNTMIKYDTKIQDIKETITALSSNGLSITLDITLWYKVIPEEIGFLHEEKGINFENESVRPAIRSSGRTAIGKYLPSELYSTKKDEVINLMEAEIKDVLEKYHVKLDRVLIRDIKLPAGLSQSIEEKLKAEQAKQRAGQEAERLIIQARADSTATMIRASTNAEANRVVNASLNEKLLKWKGIEATLKLAESPNSKVVVVGGGKSGLPIILSDK